jgi:hypothetical protein
LRHTTTRPLIPTIPESARDANPVSVGVDDDLLQGTMRIMNSKSGLQEKREFEIQFDSNMCAFAPLVGFEVGSFMYIGVTKKESAI